MWPKEATKKKEFFQLLEARKVVEQLRRRGYAGVTSRLGRISVFVTVITIVVLRRHCCCCCGSEFVLVEA